MTADHDVIGRDPDHQLFAAALPRGRDQANGPDGGRAAFAGDRNGPADGQCPVIRLAAGQSLAEAVGQMVQRDPDDARFAVFGERVARAADQLIRGSVPVIGLCQRTARIALQRRTIVSQQGNRIDPRRVRAVLGSGGFPVSLSREPRREQPEAPRPDPRRRPAPRRLRDARPPPPSG